MSVPRQLTLLAPPDGEPLTVAEARARVEPLASVSDDKVVRALIAAARSMFDGANGYLGRAIMTQQWLLTLEHFHEHFRARDKGFYHGSAQIYGHDYPPHRRIGIEIPLPPLQAIDEVQYLDSEGVLQTLASNVYQIVKGEPARLVLAPGQNWPSTYLAPDAVQITFTCGYGDDGADVDETLRTAIALQAGHLRSLMNRDVSLTSEKFGVFGETFAPAAAKALIASAVAALIDRLRVI